ncbi:hypothetical protein WCT56_10700 [Pectobacterium parmentieri]|uniref:Uncharacterized protein n=1 Tax=Pectobacterium parvum TaxID=2778550 RepID=A0AAP9IHS0_9GAMM|nr:MULTISPECIES: hypothetical protein [Pectobacterium]MBI0429427.1 hypothetical protein [Pectobacterium parmentieri]PWD62420.1 hypothetical protein DF211_14275 [Pectobacterium parmentieri]QHQ24383.1 hypothetical protein GMX10_10120 [Pectobacterium parvum]
MSNQNIGFIKEFGEVAKIVMPVITLFIGTVIGFGVEAIKSSKKRKAELNAVTSELNNELMNLKDNVVSVYNAMNNLDIYANGVKNKDEASIYKVQGVSTIFIPMKLDLMIMEKNFETLYVSVENDFRHELKVILFQKDTINKYLDEMKVLAIKESDRKKENNGNDVSLMMGIIECKKRYIYTTSCMIYSIESCINKEFSLPRNSKSDAIVDYQLNKLNIPLSPNDLKIKRTEKINM